MLYLFVETGLPADVRSAGRWAWTKCQLLLKVAGVNTSDANALELQAAVVGRNLGNWRGAIVNRGLPWVRRQRDQPRTISFGQDGSTVNRHLRGAAGSTSALG